MKMYTERHNKAGRILLDAIYNGARGSDICMADVEPAALTTGALRRPQPRARRDAPRRPTKEPRSTPGGCAPSGQTSCFATRKDTRGKTERGDICIVELKTCQDTPTELTAARLQHEELVERLVQRGYQRDKIKIYPILLGVSGTIYAAHTIDTLEQLGVQRDAAPSVALEKYTLMVQQLHSGHHPAAPGAGAALKRPLPTERH
jgi:hypothetical protein